MRTSLLALLLVACTPSETLPDCTPGATVACACVGGGSGAQTCSAGRAYGACECPDGAVVDVPGVDVATDVMTQDTAPDVAMDSNSDAADVVSEAESDIVDATTEAGDATTDAIACPMGFADCDGMAGNGCETDTRTNFNHCGGCGMRCPSPGATPVCALGHCGIVCLAGSGNCDRNDANGCEARLDTSANCGACGVSCGVRACVMGRCS